jgi:hypothetical protein
MHIIASKREQPAFLFILWVICSISTIFSELLALKLEDQVDVQVELIVNGAKRRCGIESSIIR